jgi:hypothetical protein
MLFWWFMGRDSFLFADFGVAFRDESALNYKCVERLMLTMVFDEEF